MSSHTRVAGESYQKVNTQLWPSWYRPMGGRLLPRDLIRSVAADAGYTFELAVGPAKEGRIIAIRATACVLLRERGMSFPAIGRALGGRDHTTVINAVSRFPYYCERYPGTREIYERHRVANAG